MTYDQFINECDFYQFSNEYYNTIKELMEYELMLTYLNAQNFYENNKDYLNQFTEGYFIESDIKQTDDQVNDKQIGLFKRIIIRVKKIFSAVFSFVKSLFVANPSIQQMQAKVKQIDLKKISEDNKKRLQQAIVLAWKDEWDNMFKLYKDKYDLEKAIKSLITDDYDIYPNNNGNIMSALISIEDFSKLVDSTNKSLDPKNSFLKKTATKLSMKLYTIRDAINTKMFNASIGVNTEKQVDEYLKNKIIEFYKMSDKFVAHLNSPKSKTQKVVGEASKALSVLRLTNMAGGAVGLNSVTAVTGSVLAVPMVSWLSSAFMIWGLTNLGLSIGSKVLDAAGLTKNLQQFYASLNSIASNILKMYKILIQYRENALVNIARLKLV